MALPTNSTRFISGELCGISLFSANPARKEPIIASIPANCARKAPKKTIESTKIYCEILSCTLLKNQRPIKGNTSSTNKAKTTTEIPRRIQKASSALPVAMPTMIVSTSKASVSVIIVPPTVILTALFLLIPSLLMIG